ncbi:MAG: TIGR00341 family protein [Muribaculaceae bacterium]|nr:TIGR00341 family protein [Muribaculaceae bacterium]
MADLKKIMWSDLWEGLKSYFNVTPDLEPQADIETSIRSGVSFKGSQLVVLIFAIVIASLGLNTNSIPVIIGAMLISPLMGPIIGMGLALGIQDYSLLKRSFKNICMAMLGSLAASAIYFLISPQYEGASQLLARTSPSIYDVFVGFFGGAAGILSIACRNKGQVMPGVAIATSLMPPLCTAGYGLATMQMNFFLGALYLFFTNTIFILVATWIGVKVMRFTKVAYKNEARYHRIRWILYTVVVATIGVSIWLTITMIRKNVFFAKAEQFVKNEMVFPNTQVLNYDASFEHGVRSINVTLIGQAIPKDSLQLMMLQKLDSVGLGGTRINIKQGFALESGNTEKVIDNTDKIYSIMQAELLSKQMMIDSLKSELDYAASFARESVELTPELQVLFPGIKEVAFANTVTALPDENRIDTIRIAFIRAPRGLGNAERTKLRQYLELRLDESDLHLAVNPAGFPWPESKTQ